MTGVNHHDITIQYQRSSSQSWAGHADLTPHRFDFPVADISLMGMNCFLSVPGGLVRLAPFHFIVRRARLKPVHNRDNMFLFIFFPLAKLIVGRLLRSEETDKKT
ncbi:unnamed protein product [Polarella glacialis]|uniref:Uncharacterized protein n=1 Tax=Polarella glacialis TaxID=89957 RepID=A0A813D4H2_POLGL|nr:unnamed protein product [Polarella glacialis]